MSPSKDESFLIIFPFGANKPRATQLTVQKIFQDKYPVKERRLRTTQTHLLDSGFKLPFAETGK